MITGEERLNVDRDSFLLQCVTELVGLLPSLPKIRLYLIAMLEVIRNGPVCIRKRECRKLPNDFFRGAPLAILSYDQFK